MESLLRASRAADAGAESGTAGATGGRSETEFFTAFCLQQDIFDYYPPIQERMRWIIGARDLADARKKLADYTLEGKAKQIECPMLIGYSKDDRIMDPQGALRLHQAATNSQREMVEGTGHNQASNAGGPRERRPQVFPDWAAKHLVPEA